MPNKADNNEVITSTDDVVKKEGKEKDSSGKMASNLKLINTTSGIRVSQACDRCRIKKIKCDGLTPCHNCAKVGFECKTSDKLARRAFPKGYTENLEQKLKALEEENRLLKAKYGVGDDDSQPAKYNQDDRKNDKVTLTTNDNNTVQINNPIDQIFNLDNKGVIIGNDNLNFESQFNHLLINLNLPFLKITNSHNYLLNDPNSYLYNPSYTIYNQFHNRDLDLIYNPLTVNNYREHNDLLGDMTHLTNDQLPRDVHDLFIKLINNFKKIFNNRKELDNQIIHFFLNYNVFIPIFDYKEFMESYEAFHTMYPFMFTYDDATINGFNILTNDYHVVNNYLMVVIQIYAMIMMNDPTINLNLLLNHPYPNYSFLRKVKNDATRVNDSIIRSLYDFLPYFNVFHISVNQLQTYLLFLYYSLLTNNKEKSLVLSSLVNSFIGILGINLNSNNLFFNDLSLNINQKRSRVKIFWVFKVLLKCFNLKFGFKPSLNTTVINPVTIDRYFQLTPEKLSSLLDTSSDQTNNKNLEQQDEASDDLFKTLLKPSVEFLNLMNIIIPSSFSPNYYQYLKHDRDDNKDTKKSGTNNKHLDWILNDDDGDGNDGNLNYNFTQFLTIDKNLSNWRYSLKDKEIDLSPLQNRMNLPRFSNSSKANLYHNINVGNNLVTSGISQEGLINYFNTGLPDIETASQLIKIQLNFHYLLIRSMNYLNFVIDRELTQNYYAKIANISREVLAYFLVIFEHVGQSIESWEDDYGNLNMSNNESSPNKMAKTAANTVIMESLGLNVDDDGYIINDFSVKRRRSNNQFFPGLSHANSSNSIPKNTKRLKKQIPPSPFNYMLNGLSMTIINFKKSMILQMLYLLICSMRIVNKGGQLIPANNNVLINSVDLFIKVFINYQKTPLSGSQHHRTHVSNVARKTREDDLFTKLANDELKDEILKEKRHHDDDSDEEGDLEDELNAVTDWDDEEMDEDLKFLKILKFIKYKITDLQRVALKIQKEAAVKQENGHGLLQPNQVTHHHHIHGSGGRGSQQNQTNNNPQQPMNNFYWNLPPPPGGIGPQEAPVPQQPSSQISTPGSFPGIPKMSSLSKYDFLLGDENYLNGANSFNYSAGGAGSPTPANPTNTLLGTHPGSISKAQTGHQVHGLLNSGEDNELIKKEKLAINDLMNLKHANSHSPNGAGNGSVGRSS